MAFGIHLEPVRAGTPKGDRWTVPDLDHGHSSVGKLLYESPPSSAGLWTGIERSANEMNKIGRSTSHTLPSRLTRAVASGSQ